MVNNINLKFMITPRTDDRLLELMKIHYSQPKGFVGRNICYAIYYDNDYYGHIVGGSATKYLKGRNEFLEVSSSFLDQVINNVFFSISPVNGKYPIRNFTSKVILHWLPIVARHWKIKYGNTVKGFETLVEMPRTGELYKKAGFIVVGETIGYTCKRISGKGTDTWGGRRVWNTNKDELRPKIILCKKYDYYSSINDE